MSDVTLFDFNGAGIRTLTDQEGTPWFVAADLADVLGYSSSRAMSRSLDEDEKGVQKLHSLGGAQDFTLVNESGIYHAIFMSQRSEAKAFRKWVTSEVLPNLRKTGHHALEGSALDAQMQQRTVGFRSLFRAYGAKTPPLTAIIERTLRGFDAMAQAAGLPPQYEGVGPDGEIYMVTPALARQLVETYSLGKDNGVSKAASAIAWLKDAK